MREALHGHGWGLYRAIAELAAVGNLLSPDEVLLMQRKENMVSSAGSRPGVLTPTLAAAVDCATSFVGLAMGQSGSHASSKSCLRCGSWIRA